MSVETTPTIERWYAMRATFRREMLAKSLLEQEHIECFVPLRRVAKLHRGRRVVVTEPAVSSLVFVRAVKEHLQQVKSRMPFLQYITRREGGRSEPIVVPDGQMSDFIAVCSTLDDRLEFIDGESLSVLAPGRRVRIMSGVFAGMEATFVKLSGRRNRRVVVVVDGVAAVAMANLSPADVELLPDAEK